MDVPAIVQRHRALRWLVPAGILGIAVVAATGMFRASASDQALPRMSPAALLAAVRQQATTGFSGTMVTHVALGLPDLAFFGADADAAADGSPATLLSGSHTVQIWSRGVDQQRIAVLGAGDETDVFRNGRDEWEWNSADHLAVHTTVPLGAERDSVAQNVATSLTPAALARRAIAAMDPSTAATVDNQHNVAERAAYEVVLRPRTSATKIGAVHLEIDGKTKVPLGVQIYPRESATAAIDVAFTTINFGEQAARDFAFTPPPDARVAVRRATRGLLLPVGPAKGWTSVLALRPGKAAVARFRSGPLRLATTAVAGAWGKGRLLDTALYAVLVVDDGRLYAGPVEPAALFAAAR